MANPPPQTSLISAINRGAFIPTYSVNRAEVFNNPDLGNQFLELNLRSSFQEAVQGEYDPQGGIDSYWYNDEDYTNFIRLRIVISTSEDVCRRLDFIQQRLNEYLNGSMGPINTRSGELMRQQLLLSSRFDPIVRSLLSNMGPFDAGMLTEHFKNTNQRSYFYHNDENMQNLSQTMVYEVPAINMLVTGEDGSILRESTSQTISLAGENNDLDRRLYRLEEIPAQPIKILFDNENNMGAEGSGSRDFSQMSIYAFSYFDISAYLEDREPPRNGRILTVAQSGMGYITPTVVGGGFTTFDSQDVKVFENREGQTQLIERPRQGRRSLLVGMLNPSTSPAPNIDRLDDFRTFSSESIENLNNRIFENIQRKADVSYVGNNSKVILGDNSYFSPLWLSKDVAEDIRYIFSFSLRAFMINNSKYPWLYQNSKSANELLYGGDTIQINNSEGIDERTRILDYTMSKQLLNFEEFSSQNKVGTVMRKVEKDLGSSNEEEFIEQPSALPSLFLETNLEDRIMFYEGRDILASEKLAQQLSRIQYNARFIIKDSAELFIIKYIELLDQATKEVQKIYDYITNSPVKVTQSDNVVGQLNTTGVGLFNYDTLTVAVPLVQIGLQDVDGNQITAAQLTQTAIDFYIKTLGLFGVLSGELSDRLKDKLISLSDSTNPDGLQIIADTIDNFSGVLSGIIGDGKRRFVGDGSHVEKLKIQQKGRFEYSIPILEARHSFDNFETSGLTFGTGFEYLKQSEANSTVNGILRISRNEYLNRTTSEFSKYFYIPKGELSPLDAAYTPQYAASTAAFITPEKIRTYGKSPIDQPSYRNLEGPNTEYDLDRYGELFGDLVKIREKSKYLNGSYYMLADETANSDTNTKLFNSVQTSLINRHYFNIDFDTNLDVPSLDPPENNPTVQDLVDSSRPEQFRLLPHIFGGLDELGPVSTEWLDSQSIATNQSYKEGLTPRIDQLQTPPMSRVNYPIKMMFSILGELEIDPQYSSDPDYLKNEFNSLKNLALSLGLTSQNIKEVLERDFYYLPNQFKSMFVTAISSDRLNLGGSFEATRNLLQEQDTPINTRTEVTAFIDNAEMPYDVTYDTMKIYSKMLTYWMNYKEICIVEYLSGFERTSSDLLNFQRSIIVNGSRVDMSRRGSAIIATNPYTPHPRLPVWRKLAPDNLRGVDQRNLLCRIRRITPEDITEAQAVNYRRSSTKDTYEEETSVKMSKEIGITRHELFELPIYNQYFVLGLTPTKKPPPRDEQVPLIVGTAGSEPTYRYDPRLGSMNNPYGRMR